MQLLYASTDKAAKRLRRRTASIVQTECQTLGPWYRNKHPVGDCQLDIFCLQYTTCIPFACRENARWPHILASLIFLQDGDLEPPWKF